MQCAKLESSAVLRYLVIMALLPFGSSGVVACGAVGCTCNDTVRSLSCVGLSLTAVPQTSALNVVFFNLSANNIHEIKDDDFVKFTELRRLDLSHNLLSNISANAFSHNVHLRSLSLDHNSLNANGILPAIKAPLQELYLTANRIDNVEKLTLLSSLSILDLSENALVSFPETFLVGQPNLQRLVLAGNQIYEFAANVTSSDVILLRELNLSSNSLAFFSVSGQLKHLQVLDLSWNRLSTIDPDWFVGLPNLLTLVVTGNPISFVPDFAFQYLTSLKTIDMRFLQNLTSISENVFAGLYSLSNLLLSHNSRLSFMSSLAFNNLTQLRNVDLSNNSLSSLDSGMFGALKQLEALDISGNPWLCDCVLFEEFLALENGFRNSSCALKLGPVCWDVEEAGKNTTLDPLDCRKPRILDHTEIARHSLGSSAVLNCTTSAFQPSQIIWITNRNAMITYSEVDTERLLVENVLLLGVDSYVHQYEQQNRMSVLPNGSLYVTYVTRKEGGTYRCLAANEYGNDTVTVEFQLNYQVMSTVTVTSIIVGFLTATGFFLIAVVIGVIRYLSYVCSKKERKKRKSIREVLEAIQDFKAAQFDKFSAYRTAKMDQLSAFKSAKIGQFSAFRHSRIDKLRTYKQASVTSVLQYLERMREHYACQTVRIKDNCTQQVDRLRESYGVRRGKFKDYRSHQVEKMRENYNAQVVKIREYGVQQMSRLREQYKAQQQNMLKLLELLDVGNCVSVIEAECMHTESIIFDASIAFDFEAHPIHGPRDTDSNLSDESHYLTASESGSDSNSGVVHSISFAADVEPGMEDPEVFPDFRYAENLGDSNSDIFLESFTANPMDFPKMPEFSGGSVFGETYDASVSERETEC